MFFDRHGQSRARGPHEALQLIFAALGPFSGMKKSNIHLLLQEIWPKTVNKSIKKTKKIQKVQSKVDTRINLYSSG